MGPLETKLSPPPVLKVKVILHESNPRKKNLDLYAYFWMNFGKCESTSFVAHILIGEYETNLKSCWEEEREWRERINKMKECKHTHTHTHTHSNGHGSVSRQRNRTEPKLNRLLKKKPNQTIYEFSIFKPNHLRKS